MSFVPMRNSMPYPYRKIPCKADRCQRDKRCGAGGTDTYHSGKGHQFKIFKWQVLEKMLKFYGIG